MKQWEGGHLDPPFQSQFIMLYSIHLYCVRFKDHNCHRPPHPPTSISVLWCSSSEQWCIPISRCLGLQILSRYNQLKIRIFASKSDPTWLHTYYQARVIKNEHFTHKPSSWCRKNWDENFKEALNRKIMKRKWGWQEGDWKVSLLRTTLSKLALLLTVHSAERNSGICLIKEMALYWILTAATHNLFPNFPLMEGTGQFSTPKHWYEAVELRLVCLWWADSKMTPSDPCLLVFMPCVAPSHWVLGRTRC